MLELNCLYKNALKIADNVGHAHALQALFRSGKCQKSNGKAKRLRTYKPGKC